MINRVAIRTLAAGVALTAGIGRSALISDAAALEMTKPQEQIVAAGISAAQAAKLLAPVNAFYGFWVNGSRALLDKALSTAFVDHTLPEGRPQGPAGPTQASKAFLGAVPDLKLTVVQRLVVGDRVVSHLRFTGHFTGIFMGRSGDGRSVDFIATDILRVRDGRVTDNWHLEDNLTFLQQIGFIAK